MDIFLIVMGAILTNNILLTTFLGICPFVSGVSGEHASASGMGMAVIFVLTMTVPINWLINHFVLQPLGLGYLSLIIYIVTIAFLVQIVEMFMKQFLPALYTSLGVFLPLITVNCAILGGVLFALSTWNLGFAQSAAYGFGGGLGWALAIILMAAIRERLRFAPIPEGLKGPGLALIIAGLMAMSFVGFSGMINIRDFGG
jgi:Na+-transporting NADH:ubiquinone oxidoreductase subunit E